MTDARDIPRLGAERLASGRGAYLADLPADGAREAAFVRSPVAHARLRGVDATAALALPGVDLVATHADLAALGGRAVPVGWVVPGQRVAARELLAADRVRFVGDPVAVVVAATRALAEDAAARVVLDLEPLPAVVDAEAAAAPGAPLLYPEWGDNVLAQQSVARGDADAAVDGADVVIAERFALGRQTGVPLETRGALVDYDEAADTLTVTSSSQSPHHAAEAIAAALGRPAGDVRVIVPDVGGSFGIKDHACVEEVALCALAPALGRPVRWIEDRLESLTAGVHSREQRYELELGATADGRILGLRGRLLLDAGATSGNHGIGTAVYSAAVLPGPYRFEHYRLDVTAVVTNKSPAAAYRGYGAPEAAFAMEGLLDRLADACGLEPAEVRRRNLFAPDELPGLSASGCSYDSADHPRVLRMALELAAGAARTAAPTPEGERLRGVGIACFVLMGGFGPSRAAIDAGMTFGGHESAVVRLDADGGVTLSIGMPTQGQGIETALAQVCAEALGLDPRRDVRLVSQDTATTPYSPVGAIASRGAAVGGSAVALAARTLAGHVRARAAERLGIEPAAVALRAGAAAAAAGGEAIALADLAQDGPPLEGRATVDPAAETFSYGAHVAVVDVDPGTGAVELVRYAAVSDCGTQINPAIVRGQVEGGVVQGIGGALMEELRFAPDGQPLTQTLFEYAIPTAADVPRVDTAFLETPTDRTATGARGGGEIGIIGPGAAIAGAVWNAIGGSVAPTALPLTPERVRALVRARDAAAPGARPAWLGRRAGAGAAP